MLKKLTLIISTVVLSSSLLFGQKDLDQTTIDVSNFFEKDWSIGFNYGITKFNGDISQYAFVCAKQTGLSYQDSDFQESRSAFAFSLEKKISNKFSFNIEYVTGEFAGLRRPNEYIGYEIDYPYEIAEGSLDGNKFVTSFNEIDMLFNYSLNSCLTNSIKKELPENLSVIVKMGFGYNVFRSLRTNLYSDEYVYSHGYDELTKNESKNGIAESVIIYGAKIKYEINDGVSLLVYYTVRNSLSDKWDSSIMDGGQGNDKFSLFSCGLAYTIPEKVNAKD